MKYSNTDKLLSDLLPQIKQNGKFFNYILENPNKTFRFLSDTHRNNTSCGIYAIYSLENDTFYVGKAENFSKRMNSHKSDFNLNKGHGIWFQNTYKKYGIDNLITFQLENCEKSNLNKNEVKWINYFDSYKNGFNVIDCEGFNFKDPEAIRKINSKIFKPVICLSLQGEFIEEFECIKYAANKYNIDSSGIMLCCKNKSRKCGNYIWIYKENYNSDKKYPLEIIKYSFSLKQRERILKNSKKLILLDINNNILNEFESVISACNYFNINKSTINRILSNKTKNSQFGIWKIVEKQ